MESKVCVICNTEQSIDNFFNKYIECKQRVIQRSMKPYYENKDKKSIQQEVYYEKNRHKLLEKQNDYRNKKTQIIKNYLDHMLTKKTSYN